MPSGVLAAPLIGEFFNLVGAVTNPFLTGVGQATNYLSPIVLPTAHAAIMLNLRGQMSDKEAQDIAWSNGAWYVADATYDENNVYQKSWKDFSKILQPLPDISTVLSGLVRGVIHSDFQEELLRLTAADPKIWGKIIDGFRNQLTPEQVLVLWNRGDINEQQATDALRAYGGFDAAAMARLKTLRHPIPSPTDLVHFVVKDAFDLGTVKSLGYDKEMPAEFVRWMDAQGYGKEIEIAGEGPGAFELHKWSSLYWWSHWRNLAPTQIYELLHRSRPSKDDPSKSMLGDFPPFTMADVSLHLKTADYPQPIREQLAALSYRVPSTQQIRTFLRYDVINREKAKSYYQDRGYTADDAEVITESEMRRVKVMKGARYAQFLKARVLEAYQLGTIDANAVQNALEPVGWLPDEIAGMLLSIDLDRESEAFKAVLKSIKQAFLLGVISENIARNTLAVEGIQADVIQTYLRTWRAMLSLPRKQLSTERALQLYRIGLLSRQDAITRLENLGWATPELVLQLAATDRQILEDGLKEQAKRQREQRQRERESRAPLIKVPVARLIKWLCTGRIDEGTFRERMRAHGWQPVDVDRLISEGCGDDENN